MSKPVLIFMGTPAFAATVLKSLVRGGYAPTLVITNEDRPVGRKAQLLPPPVKEEALVSGIPILQPTSLRDPLLLGQLAKLQPDLIVTAAYGRLLPRELLDLPKVAAVNVHASLLPRHRGASPVQATLLAGDPKTGVSIMQMAESLDSGAVYAQAETAIGEKETAGELEVRLAALAGPLLLSQLEALLSGRARATAQDEQAATYCGRLDRQSGALHFEREAVELERLVRAMWPWPAAYTELSGRRIKVAEADLLRGVSGEPGSIVGLSEGIDVACGQDALRLKRIVPAGSRPMEARALAHNLTLGQRFALLTP